MGYVEDGTTLFDRATAAAREIVGGLRPGDTASIVLAGRKAGGPRLYSSAADAGTRRRAPGTQRCPRRHARHRPFRGRRQGRDARRVLPRAEQGGLRPERPARQRLAARRRRGREHTSRDDRVLFVQVRPKTVANRAITAVQYAAARPMAGVPFAIRPHVTIQGEPAGDAVVRLVIDGKPVAERGSTNCRAAGGPSRGSTMRSPAEGGTPDMWKSTTRHWRRTTAVISPATFSTRSGCSRSTAPVAGDAERRDCSS